MQVKLRQLAYTAVLVVVIFLFNAQTNQANAAVLKRPVANIASVKNSIVLAKTTHTNINVEPKAFAPIINPATPSPVTLPTSEHPAVTVEPVKDNMVAYEVRSSRYGPIVKISNSAKVVFKRTQVNNAFDNLGLTVYYGISGTASPSDYEGLTSHSVYFPPNIYEVEVVIAPVIDDIYEADGESVIFTVVADQGSVRNPLYQLGKQIRAKIMIGDYSPNNVFDFTINDNKEVAISSGQPVDLELTGNARCFISGGQFGPVGQSWQSGGSLVPYPLVGSFNLSTWTTTVYPTESIEYLMQCTGYMGAQRSATVRINVSQ